jgi:hypothetical protein
VAIVGCVNLGWEELVLLAALLIAACGWIASKKGRSASGWVGLALLFGPLALIAVCLAPRKPANPLPSAAA